MSKPKCQAHGNVIMFDKDGLPFCPKCKELSVCPSCGKKTMYPHTCRECLLKEKGNEG